MKAENKKGRPYEINLPGFIVQNDIGLGDAIKRVTTAIGINPCTSCEQRAFALNRHVMFTSKKIKNSKTNL